MVHISTFVSCIVYTFPHVHVCFMAVLMHVNRTVRNC